MELKVDVSVHSFLRELVRTHRVPEILDELAEAIRDYWIVDTESSKVNRRRNLPASYQANAVEKLAGSLMGKKQPEAQEGD
jgi:RPA family protein